MNVASALQVTRTRLEAAGIEDASLESEYLVAAASGRSRMQLVLNREHSLNLTEETKLSHYVKNRTDRQPLAYVLGEQPFHNLSLEVNPSVLIPRPETELLVERAWQILNQMKHAVVTDIGTGSGAIALALAPHPNVERLIAVDVSAEALRIARSNALRNQIQKPLEWLEGNLLQPLINRSITVDFLIANLPYVKTADIETLSPEVRREPRLALDGGIDGLDLISDLIQQAGSVLKSGGRMLLEIGSDQGNRVKRLFVGRPEWCDVSIYPDLNGLPRMVFAQRGI